MIIREDEFVSFSTAEWCKIGTSVDPMWGSDYETINLEDINHLMSGGVIRFKVGGEYNCFLRFEGTKNE